MNVYELISDKIKNKLKTIPEFKAFVDSDVWDSVVVEVPKNRNFGDFSTNVAMVLTKIIKNNPHKIAETICPYIKEIEEIKDVSIAGAGFININLSNKLWEDLVNVILIDGDKYGNSNFGKGEKINIEFLSANPTGPIHIGHARGAIIGDVLSRLFQKNGFLVTKEYYINDYGHQVNVLANSVYWRYQELFGLHKNEFLPEGSYPGEYLVSVAQEIKDNDGDKWLKVDKTDYIPYFKKFASSKMMILIKESLKKIGIEFDVFTSERELVESKQIEKTLKYMESKNFLYKGVLPKPLGEVDEDWTPSEQLLFKSTDFGDDSDRVVMRSNGETTYFASDIAYHLNKFNRGFKKQINVWGADHGGYVKRIKSALTAVTDNQAELDIILCQIVNLEKDGKPFKMSKRAGNFVMIEDVLEEIDSDVLRLFMITKSPDTQMTFDLEKAKEQSKDNPVYYIQYAYARANSVVKKYCDVFHKNITSILQEKYDFDLAIDVERKLIKTLGEYPSIIISACKNKAPNLLTKYLEDVSNLFHSLWAPQSGVKLVISENEKLTNNHMLMVMAFKNVISNGLKTLGCNIKETM